MIDVYSLLSHTTAYLPYQAMLLRRQLRDCRITVVEDPGGAGAIRLTHAEIAAWGIDRVVHACHTRSMGFARHRVLLDWIIQQTSGLSLILHGDAFPVRPFDPAELLDGKSAAGICYPIADGRSVFGSAWILLNDLDSYRDLSWDSSRVTRYVGEHRAEKVAEAIGLDAIDPTWKSEWCSPAFLHMNLMGAWGKSPAIDAGKVRLLESLFRGVPSLAGSEARVVLPAPRVAREPFEIDRNRDTCHECAERPMGCWKNYEFGCEKQFREAERYATRYGDCPLKKWGAEAETEFSTRTRRIIFIFSGERFADRLALCERTWIKDAREAGQGVIVVKPILDPSWPESPQLVGSTLYVPCFDSIDSLPDQMRFFLRWALARDDWDYLFKCDDDTYVSTPRFLAYDTQGSDYIGQRLRPGFGHGGAGYWMSRRAAEILADRLWIGPGAKDRKVGDILRGAGMPIRHDHRFMGYGWRDRPTANNDLVTGHRMSEHLWIACHAETGLGGSPPVPAAIAVPESHLERAMRVRRERGLSIPRSRPCALAR